MDIVIVESSAAARAKLRRMVEDLGHRVVAEVETGTEGAEACARLRPDVVTIDIKLADVDAYSLISQLVQKQRTLRVIAVGTLARASRVLPARKAGAAHFLLRPFKKSRIRELLSQVEKLSIAA